MGILFKFVDTQLWSLVSVEPLAEPLEITGEFIADNVTHDMSNNLGKKGSLGRQTPIISFLSGETEVVKFQAIIWQDHVWSPIEPKIEKMKKLLNPQSISGLPPVMAFTHGTLTMDCLVKSIGGIKYREPNFFGEMKSAIFEMELWRFKDTAFELTQASGEEPETKFVIAKRGDYYEKIAAAEYGNALLGINLRKLHEVPFLEVGDPVKILRPTHSKIRQAIAPENFLLARSNENKQLIADHFETRGNSKLSHIIG